MRLRSWDENAAKGELTPEEVSESAPEPWFEKVKDGHGLQNMTEHLELVKTHAQRIEMTMIMDAFLFLETSLAKTVFFFLPVIELGSWLRISRPEFLHVPAYLPRLA